MDAIKRVTGWPFQFGGVEHFGWLPPGSAKPLPMPIENVALDVKIEPSGSTDCLLCWQSQDGRHSGDSWHPTLADAERGAFELFGIKDADWD